MNQSLIVVLLLTALVIFISIFSLIRKGRIPVKFSIVWFFIVLILILLVLCPIVLETIQVVFGFKTTSNLVVGIFITLLIFTCIVLTVIISGLTKKVNLLIQEVSILKMKVENNKLKK